MGHEARAQALLFNAVCVLVASAFGPRPWARETSKGLYRAGDSPFCYSLASRVSKI